MSIDGPGQLLSAVTAFYINEIKKIGGEKFSLKNHLQYWSEVIFCKKYKRSYTAKKKL